MGTEVIRPYRGVSAEERRTDRHERLKRACLDVIGEHGVADVTVEAVCRRAGLTKRYFYESFPDRDRLFAEVIDDFFHAVRAEILAALSVSPPTPEARALAVARTLIGFLERDPRQARMYSEAAGDAALRARRDIAFETYTQLLLDSLPGEGDACSRRIAALIVVAGTTQAATTWLRGGIAGDRDQLITQIARLITAAMA